MSDLVPDLVYRHRPGTCCPHDGPCWSPENGPSPPGGYPNQQRRPTGGAARAARSGQPIREFGGRRPRRDRPRRRAGWLLVAALAAATVWMGTRAWDAAPVDSTGCPTTSQECPR